MMSSQEIGVLTRQPRAVRAHPKMQAPPRWLLMCRRLYEGGAITIRWLQEEFGVSLATAKRDMATIEANLPTVRDPRDHPSHPVTIRLLRGPRVHGHINDERSAQLGRKGALK